MGLTERHWFEEEDMLNERQLENEVEYGERRYQAGYKKGYADALASRPQGHWIKFEGPDDNDNAQYNCSNCGAGDISAVNQVIPYCWRCGAKMLGKFNR